MSHKVKFDYLDDVDMAGKSNGDVPAWDSVAGKYKPGSGGATFGTPALTFDTTNTNGTTDEAIRRDAQIALFDSTAPVTQAYGDTAATGSAAKAARRDHKHGMPAAGGGGTGGTYAPAYANKSVDYGLGSSDDVVTFDTAGKTATLPDAASDQNHIFYIKNTSTGTITVATTSSQTIDGATTMVLGSEFTLAVISNGSNWVIV